VNTPTGGGSATKKSLKKWDDIERARQQNFKMDGRLIALQRNRNGHCGVKVEELLAGSDPALFRIL